MYPLVCLSVEGVEGDQSHTGSDNLRLGFVFNRRWVGDRTIQKDCRMSRHQSGNSAAHRSANPRSWSGRLGSRERPSTFGLSLAFLSLAFLSAPSLCLNRFFRLFRLIIESPWFLTILSFMYWLSVSLCFPHAVQRIIRCLFGDVSRQGVVHGHVGVGCVVIIKVDIGDVVDSPGQVALLIALVFNKGAQHPKH